MFINRRQLCFLHLSIYIIKIKNKGKNKSNNNDNDENNNNNNDNNDDNDNDKNNNNNINISDNHNNDDNIAIYFTTPFSSSTIMLPLWRYGEARPKRTRLRTAAVQSPIGSIREFSLWSCMSSRILKVKMQKSKNRKSCK